MAATWRVVKKPPHKSEFQVGRAEFIISAARSNQFPSPDRPEIAFAGRSNVGKSSLLNRLLQRRKLARTSRTPGRTQLINFFDVDGRLYFVDLPGFGYAKVPLSVRAAWQPMVEGYLSASRDIRTVVLLVDIRREPGREEINLLDYLDYQGVPSLIIVTKADKITKNRRPKRLSEIRKSLGLKENPIAFSAISGEGREEVWAHLADACDIGLL